MRAHDQVARHGVHEGRGAYVRCVAQGALGIVRRPHRVGTFGSEGVGLLRGGRDGLVHHRARRAHTQRRGRVARAEAIAERGQRAGLLRREAEHACRVAHGAPPAPGDVLAHHRRVLPAVACVHVLQHALPLAVREVDVDVRCLGAFLAQETLEQQLELDRVHCGDAEAVADRAVRRRAAALTEDPLTARETHDVPDDQEVPREPELRDQREFVRELLVVPRRAPPPPALLRAGLDQPFEVLVLRHARREREVRQARLEHLQSERAALGHRERRRESSFLAAPARGELRMTLEMPLTVGAQPRSHLVERRAVAERGEHVVREPAAGERVVHVVGHHPRQVERPGERDQLAHERALLGERVVPALDRETAVEELGERAGGLTRGACGIWTGEQLRHPPARTPREREESAGMRCELVERHPRLTARMIEPRARDQRAEIPPPLA